MEKRKAGFSVGPRIFRYARNLVAAWIGWLSPEPYRLIDSQRCYPADPLAGFFEGIGGPDILYRLKAIGSDVA